MDQVDVNDPGDLIFLNCVFSGKQPLKCEGWDEANIVSTPVKYKDGTEVMIDRIHCPQSCPRDCESTQSRCRNGIRFAHV